MKNMLRLIAIYMGSIIALTSCEKYEDPTTDYDYSAVYFGTQKPLRTIVAKEEMKFKFGAVLGGKRENSGEWVKFSVDPSLLKKIDGADQFTMLPKSFYSMDLKSEGDCTLYIQAGTFLGDMNITLNKEAFLNDPLAVSKKYAIPLRLYETSADSILYGNAYTPSKAYTIIAVKYILPEHCAYYGTGVEKNSVTEKETSYEITKGVPRWMKTLSATELQIDALGNATTGAANKLKVILSEDRSSVYVGQVDGGAAVTDLGSTYSKETMTFNLKYSFERSGESIIVNETLTPRQEAEKELRFEEW